MLCGEVVQRQPCPDCLPNSLQALAIKSYLSWRSNYCELILLFISKCCSQEWFWNPANTNLMRCFPKNFSRLTKSTSLPVIQLTQLSSTPFAATRTFPTNWKWVVFNRSFATIAKLWHGIDLTRMYLKLIMRRQSSFFNLADMTLEGWFMNAF